MYCLIFKAQKKRALNNKDEWQNLIEVDPEISKEIVQVLQLSSIKSKSFKIFNSKTRKKLI